MIRYLYMGLGLITLTIGIIGIVTPMIPVTPLLLLTAILFSKSSPKMHKMLMDNKVTGKYIKRINEGFSLKACLISIAFMWCMICFSAFVLLHGNKARTIIFVLGVIGTLAQLIVYNKKKKKSCS